MAKPRVCWMPCPYKASETAPESVNCDRIGRKTEVFGIFKVIPFGGHISSEYAHPWKDLKNVGTECRSKRGRFPGERHIKTMWEEGESERRARNMRLQRGATTHVMGKIFRKLSRFDQINTDLIVPTPSESVATQEHTDKITADETPKSEPEREETPEPESIPEKGYGLSMELDYDDEIFSIPEDQQEQTFGQESAEDDNSEVSEEEMPEQESALESQSKAQLQEWLDALEQITFGSEAGDVEASNQLRQRLAELEQKVLQEEAEENQAADQRIRDIDPEVEDLGYIQNDKDDEIVKATHNRVQQIVEAPRRLNYIMLPEEVPQAKPVKGTSRKEIDNLFRRLLEEDSEDDETKEEAEARLIAENNARWERCLEYRRQYCEEHGSDDEEAKEPQDFRGGAMYEDEDNNSSDDEEFYDNRNSIWE
ncbi:hypothetical protein C8F04DRAFT_1179258 [Mycena alexandri]|uniref:Uncharacterized protein n=1 Tax=Mycena alexandri TaxID=1745969 RepID=A0AAD6T7T4_9AGAR|nr:hypothetical protein C8F04DRAFT_1179258 [Mycena alexandri]